MKPRSAAVATVITLAVVVLSAARAFGAAGSQADGTADTFGAAGGSQGAVLIDLTQVGHSDDGSNITWTFDTANSINGDNVDHIQWDLDLNSNGTFAEPTDACIILTSNGGTTGSAALKAGCGNFINGTSSTTINGKHITFSFGNKAFRDATGFSGTSYKYRATSVDFNNNEDIVPNAAGTPNTFNGSVTHSGVTLAGASSAPTATPAPSTVGQTPSPAPVVTRTPTPTTQTVTPTPARTANVSAATISSDPGATPRPTRSLPTTGANVMYMLVGGGAFVYAGIELLGAKAKLENADDR